MEQEKKKGPGVFLLAAAAAVVCLSLSLTGDRARAASAAAPAELDAPRQPAVQMSQPEVGRRVIPLGKAVGIKLFSDGVLVVGLSPVETGEGRSYPGKDCGLKTGDVITHINGGEVDTIEEVQALVAQYEDEPLTIQAVRGQRQLQLTAAAVENSQGVYQLGVWLRDSMAGIGTMTFYDPASGVFGALGHGINDVDTSMLMPLESGSIMPATVSEVKRGTSGEPGELHGQFDLTRDLGTLYANTALGIFGQMPQETVGDGVEPVEVASRSQVQAGPAAILSNIQGDEVEEFDIEILHLYPGGDGTRNMMIRVTDPELLAATGGIVQGMSGSPILQNGRLVGAVTHVLVNDPTRGYAILAENMLEQAVGKGSAADR
ncbi:MAG: SpoIVB peptidase [Lawsonibacter sp.]|nr:SpoIVB peptidase [Lawsonibacter sp.]